MNSKNPPLHVIIDNGHGIDTPGKRSPDGRLHEWAYTRRLARALARRLADAGIASTLLVPEDADIPLGERVRRANALAVRYRRDMTVLLSLHVNASGRSGWGRASGWSAFVSPRASSASEALAYALSVRAAARGLGGDRATPPEGFWRAGFAMLSRTRCPAVLTENMMMDNPGDLAFLLSPDSVNILADIHLQALLTLV